MDYIITNLIDELLWQVQDAGALAIWISLIIGGAIAQYAGKYAALREKRKGLDMNDKRIAILGGGLGSMGARVLMAAVVTQGCQASIVGMDGYDFVRKRTTRKERSEKSRIKTVWYTVDSPEVKRMSKG